MKRVCWLAGLVLWLPAAAVGGDGPPKPLLTGLNSPLGVAVGTDNRVYITTFDGQVLVLDKGKAVPFTREPLKGASGIAAYLDGLFVTAGDRVYRLDAKGEATLFAPPN